MTQVKSSKVVSSSVNEIMMETELTPIKSDSIFGDKLPANEAELLSLYICKKLFQSIVLR